jgi:hypothetical protein
VVVDERGRVIEMVQGLGFRVVVDERGRVIEMVLGVG